MSEILKPKRKVSGVERVVLNKEIVTKLDQWIAQLQTKYTGIKIKRSELANWILENREPLSDEDARKIGEEFYDQIDFAQWILHQVRDAKTTGKTLLVSELINKKHT